MAKEIDERIDGRSLMPGGIDAIGGGEIDCDRECWTSACC